MLAYLDEHIRPFAQPSRPASQPYDFQWHGLMGYMDGGVRVIGAHPGRPALLYNLGCNGVGFLPSIHGGRQIPRILSGSGFNRASSTRADLVSGSGPSLCTMPM